ncbi:SigE family RNA polymerase sigma factor [Kineosporia sp. A_224]|uniref:SigE family RNA polymerase sigma factor n=1 Tax=Kineosporia sp. A_224 TaxID=1962180 RepID=UPI000B4B132A|nr:SigE family RNA polymerase sigma factor [Kineosporia sp. A_224]
MTDRSGFDAFVAARSHRLLRTCYLLTRNWASAEDLLQTALAKAWFAWGRIEGDPEPYVRAVVANTYTSWWRRRWTHEEPTDAVHAPDDGGRGAVGAAPALFADAAARRDATADVDERDLLWSALGRLPRRQRAVVVLRFYEDLTEAQTAAALGVAVGTVKSQTSKALAAMRVDPALARTTDTTEVVR